MVVFKKRFVNKLQKLENWLLNEFGSKVTREIIGKIGNSIHHAAMLPNPGRRTSNPEIRSLFIPPYIRVYFTNKGGKFTVLNMYDMRRNPDRNIYE